ncbi:MAG TPA: hypothetical protein VGP08_00400 [Pyrinomonadaceae bacterium]|jgi:hypothetical protein|nr:hypothetical protein [Pyrinomonadaceae bacterium]
MYSLLLRKALPFALTFILGSLVGGLFKSVGFGGQSFKSARAYHYGYGEGHSCRMRFQRRNLVAESKPLNILFKPGATMSVGADSLRRGTGVGVMALVTFGADGTVKGVESGSLLSTCGKDRVGEVSGDMLEAISNAASQIQFEPETVNSVPVTVTREVEIRVTFN